MLLLIDYCSDDTTGFQRSIQQSSSQLINPEGGKIQLANTPNKVHKSIDYAREQVIHGILNYNKTRIAINNVHNILIEFSVIKVK